MGRKRKSGMIHNKNAKTYKTTGRHLPPTSSTSQPHQYICETYELSFLVLIISLVKMILANE